VGRIVGKTIGFGMNTGVLGEDEERLIDAFASGDVYNYCTVEQEVNKKYQKTKKSRQTLLITHNSSLTISFAQWSM
jgi:hypothetical protein